MKRVNWRHLAGTGVLVAAITMGQGHSSSAAPVLTNTAAVRDAVTNNVVHVRYGYGGAFVGGLVLGGLIGGAIARPYYYSYPYYGYYGYPAYPVYRPYYYGYPAYGYYPRYYRRHYHHRR
jgi:hypothetical protein